MAPWADVCYFADTKWFGWHKGRAEFRDFAGAKCTIEPTGMLIDDGAVHMLRNADSLDRVGLSEETTALATGRNSGHQAINLAVLAGARRILLLGYDGRVGPNGRTHFHGGHPDRTHGGLYAQNFRVMVEPLKKLGVEIVNASPGSAIDAFPRVPLDLVEWFQCAPSA